jgi:hypothetical protein
MNTTIISCGAREAVSTIYANGSFDCVPAIATYSPSELGQINVLFFGAFAIAIIAAIIILLFLSWPKAKEGK